MGKRDHRGGGESLAFRTVGRVGPVAIRWLRADGSFQPQSVSADQEIPLCYHARTARLLLVRAASANRHSPRVEETRRADTASAGPAGDPTSRWSARTARARNLAHV